MERRACGNTGLTLPVLGVGVWSFGGGEGDYWGSQDDRDATAVVDRALALGANYFHTAEMYNNGLSEAALGRVLAGRREQALGGGPAEWEEAEQEGEQAPEHEPPGLPSASHLYSSTSSGCDRLAAARLPVSAACAHRSSAGPRAGRAVDLPRRRGYPRVQGRCQPRGVGPGLPP